MSNASPRGMTIRRSNLIFKTIVMEARIPSEYCNTPSTLATVGDCHCIVIVESYIALGEILLLVVVMLFDPFWCGGLHRAGDMRSGPYLDLSVPLFATTVLDFLISPTFPAVSYPPSAKSL